MANKTRLRIVTPTREIYDNEAEMVIMHTEVGDLGVLPGHQPLTTILGYGVLRIKNEGKELKATVFSGFADIQPTEVTILSDVTEWPDEIDLKRAEAAKERAEKRIQSGGSEHDTLRAELALRRALIRINIAKSNKD